MLTIMTDLRFFILLLLSVKIQGYDQNAICKVEKCILKCCPEGEIILDSLSKTCQAPQLKVNLSFDDVALYNSDFTKSGRVLRDIFTLIPGTILNPEFGENANDYSIFDHNFYLLEDGTLFQEVPNEWDRWYKINDSSRFCVDYHYPTEENPDTFPVRFFTILEFEEPLPDDEFIAWGLLISCFFLFLVLVVYSLLLELQNLCGMVLMAYVASLFGAFLFLAILQLAAITTEACTGLSYATYFLFLTSFCWMNVMSYDIWRTFRGYARARPANKRRDLFMFGMYCIYACGLPAIMTIMVVSVNETDMKHLPWFVTPNISKKGCFFGDAEKMLYLYIPMLILILCNWMFFLMTAFNIWRLHRDTAVLDSAAAGTSAAHRSQKYRFLVYLKLSVIMGINWVLEVVSAFQPHFKGWYITDVYNILIGVSIFLIFVCKRKIYKRLVAKYQAVRKGEPAVYSKSLKSSSNTESDVMQSVQLNSRGPPNYSDNC